MSDLITKRGHELAMEIIKKFESCKLKAYRDMVGVPTIGWGTTHYPNGGAVVIGDHISQADAEKFIANDMHTFEAGIKAHIPYDLNDHMDAALISFCYNLGLSSLYHSTMLKYLVQGKNDKASREFGKWCHAGGKKVRGLVRRREMERKLFIQGD